MNDKTLIIIFCIINLITWLLVLDFMIRTKHNDCEILRKYAETEKRIQEYYHETFQCIGNMTEVNVKAMDHFLHEISVKIDSGESETIAEKSGK